MCIRDRGLLRIAGATGGLAFYNTSNFKAAFARVQQDTEFRYVLGYSLPTHDPKDIADHKFFRGKVEATVPGLKIRAREGLVDAGSCLLNSVFLVEYPMYWISCSAFISGPLDVLDEYSP